MKKTGKIFSKGIRTIAVLSILLNGCIIPSNHIVPESSLTSNVWLDQPREEPTQSIAITIQSNDASDDVQVITIDPTVIPEQDENTHDKVVVSDTAEPIIFVGMEFSHHQKCGHGDVVAWDGHALQATPELVSDGSNFLEKLPEGSRVDIIDCRLWTDTYGFSWLAVRTEAGKLGWMVVQSDKFYVTVYPIAEEVPQAITGIPVGKMEAYVPPSSCQTGPVTTEATATSIGVDLIPVVGDIKGLEEVYTGCDMVTGEPLGNWRWLGLLGLIGLAELSLLRYSDEVAGGARIADNVSGSLKYSDEATIAALKNTDTASDFLKHLDELDEVTDLGTDAMRYLDEGVDLSDEAIHSLAKLEQPCSFAPDTIVMTVAGPRPIASIQPGDKVLGFNEHTGNNDYFLVTASFSHFDQTIVKLGIGNDVIVTTPEHPFYVKGAWIAAIDLELGALVYASNGESYPVTWMEIEDESAMMYNLSVDQVHTYYVGSENLLVHNACSRILRKNLGDPGWGEAPWQAHHIIPGQFEKEGHPFVVRAMDGGWKIDGAGNGVSLPYLDEDAARLGVPAHRGSHPQYSSRVRNELDDLNRRAINEGWDDQRCAYEMQKLTDRFRRDLLNTYSGKLPY
jgi:hypothetical protein